MPSTERPIHSIEWTGPDAEAPTDVTDAVTDAHVAATPHPDPDVAEPKGYSIVLTLRPDSTAFADALQDALVAFDPITVSLRLAGADAAITDLPVGVTRVPHLGEQNEAELSVKPEGHDRLHPYF
jgi:hypothetical protein